jgi:hypothetical protein
MAHGSNIELGGLTLALLHVPILRMHNLARPKVILRGDRTSD